MAYNVELRRSNGASFNDIVYVKSHWNIVDGKPATYPPTAHEHTILNSVDTRDDNELPPFYDSKYTFEFKRNTVIGLTGVSGVYSSVVTYRAWSDDSGGYAWQIAYSDDAISARKGLDDGGWGAWQRIYSGHNKPTWTDIQSKPDEFAPAPHTRWTATRGTGDDCYLDFTDDNVASFGRTFGGLIRDYGDSVLNHVLWQIGGLDAKYGLSIDGKNVYYENNLPPKLNAGSGNEVYMLEGKLIHLVEGAPKEVYTTGNPPPGSGFRSIKNFGTYVATNGTTAIKVPTTEDVGDKIIGIEVSNNTAEHTRVVIFVKMPKYTGTSYYGAVMFTAYSNTSTYTYLYKFEIYCDTLGFYIDDAYRHQITDGGAEDNPIAITTNIYIHDVYII